MRSSDEVDEYDEKYTMLLISRNRKPYHADKKKGCLKKYAKCAMVYFAFATFMKLVLIYYAVTLPYRDILKQVKCYIYTCPAEPQAPLLLSSAFGVSGIGNLLFQYASLYGLAKQTGRQPVIPEDFRLKLYFPQLSATVGNSTRPGEKWEQFTGPRSSTYIKYIPETLAKSSHNAELVGYFQSWIYFQNYTDDVRKEFTFGSDIINVARSFLMEIKMDAFKTSGTKRPLTFIGVHVRRGDMASTEFLNFGYTAASAEYINKAMTLFENSYRDVLFAVSSDDLTWCKSNINTTKRFVYFSEGHSDIEDLAILSQCNHTIISTGTFGWWAAFLAGGDAIYYANFPSKGSRLERGFSKTRKDYYFPTWTSIE